MGYVNQGLGEHEMHQDSTSEWLIHARNDGMDLKGSLSNPQYCVVSI